MINKVYYFEKDVRNVTEVYYGIIISSLKKNGATVESLLKFDFFSRCPAKKEDYFIVTGFLTFLIVYLRGYRNFIIWFQGIAPEEVFLITKSKLKLYLFAVLEKMALKKCKYKIGVSKYQFQHFEEKYKIYLNPEDVFIMPCFNSVFNSELFHREEKYKKDIFCYAGGMQAWQGVDEILKLYAEIEKRNPKAFLKILSKELDVAKEKLNKYNIINYSLDSVPQERVSSELAVCKYGFIIREDIIINNVATPTKLAAYVGNGIIPIFTSAVHFYRDLAKEYKYLCCIDNPTDVEPILRLMEEPIIPKDLEREYKRLFENHFSTTKYVESMTVFFRH